MTNEYFKQLNVLNLRWMETCLEAYRIWCVGVMNLVYEGLEDGDKVFIVINQKYHNRPELLPFAADDGHYVTLNCSASAVIRFEMDASGIAFECGLRGIPVYNRYDWDEITSVFVSDGDHLKLSMRLDPNETHYLTGQVLAQMEQMVAPEPTIEPGGNVVVADFGKRRK